MEQIKNLEEKLTKHMHAINDLASKINQNQKNIDYHVRQVEKLKEKIEILKEMVKNGSEYTYNHFKNLLEKRKAVKKHLEDKLYVEYKVGDKTFYITDEGEVYSEARKYKTWRQSNGYQMVQVNKAVKYLHRLVWEAFYGQIPHGMEIDHINTNRDDNHLDNLRMVTSKENKNNPITIEHYKISNRNKGIVRYRREAKNSL